MNDIEQIAAAMFKADHPDKPWPEPGETPMRSFYVDAARRWLAAWRVTQNHSQG